VSLPGTLPQKLAAAGEAGFDAVEVLDRDLEASGLTAGQVRHIAADSGVTVAVYQPLRDFEGVPEDSIAGLERARRMLAIMAELGARILVSVSSTLPDAPDREPAAGNRGAGVAGDLPP
jgi:4-hydroxyphenylpyruvate dioxygenase